MTIFVILFSALLFLLSPLIVGSSIRLLFRGFECKSKIWGVNGAITIALGIWGLGFIYMGFRLIDIDIQEIHKKTYFTVYVICLIVVLLNFKKVTPIFTAISNKDEFVYIAAIALIGMFALLSFPYVYDTAQLNSLLKFVNVENEFRAYDRGMFGYSGMILPVAYVFAAYPLPLVAAGAKLLLALLYAVCIYMSLYVANREKSASFGVLLISVLFSSSLGLYGITVLGKDTMFGVAFMWLFMLSFHSRVTDEVPDIYKSILLIASFSLGIVTLPYLFIFSILILFCTDQKLRLFEVARYTFLLGGFALSYAVEKTTGIDFWLVCLICYCVGLSLTITKEFWITVLSRYNQFVVPFKVLAIMPLVFVFICYFLMPLNIDINSDFNFEWSNIRAPLGEAEFLSGLLYGIHVEKIMSPLIFSLGSILMVFSGFFFRDRVLLAIILMPLTVMMLCTLHVYFDWHVIRYRLLWDLYKDVPQWLSGLYIGLALVLLVNAASNKISFVKERYWQILVFTLALVAFYAPDREINLPSYKLTQLAYFEDDSAHSDKIMLNVMGYSRKNPQLRLVIFERGLVFPGPQSLSQSFGYDSIYWNAKSFILPKYVAWGDEVLFCWRKKAPARGVLLKHKLRFNKDGGYEIDGSQCDSFIKSEDH